MPSEGLYWHMRTKMRETVTQCTTDTPQLNAQRTGKRVGQVPPSVGASSWAEEQSMGSGGPLLSQPTPRVSGLEVPL